MQWQCAFSPSLSSRKFLVQLCLNRGAVTLRNYVWLWLLSVRYCKELQHVQVGIHIDRCFFGKES